MCHLEEKDHRYLNSLRIGVHPKKFIILKIYMNLTFIPIIEFAFENILFME